MGCGTSRTTVNNAEPSARAAQADSPATSQASTGCDRERTVDEISVCDLGCADRGDTTTGDADVTSNRLVDPGTTVIYKNIPARERTGR